MKSILKRIALAITVIGLFYGNAVAQDTSKAQGKSEATVGISYYKKADQSKTAVAVIKAKNKEGKFAPAVNAKVDFYVMKDKVETLLQSATTDYKGEAVIVLQKDLPVDTGHAFTIVAKIENNDLYEDAEEQMTYKEVNITLNLNPHDTAHVATAHVTTIGADGKEIPVKDVEVKFYVQRLFGIMLASDESTVTTDENGEAVFAYPKNLPGDTAGAFNIVARIEDNEQYGNAEINAATSWGTVLALITDPFPRALWAPNAPIQLILTLSILFGGVWCTYFFIIYQLVKIKKDGKLAAKA